MELGGKMREDEKEAMDFFIKFLESRSYTRDQLEWIPGDDPPDALLRVSEKWFAVEITNMMFEYGKWSEAGVKGFIEKFTKEIEDELATEGVEGWYNLNFSPNFRYDFETFSREEKTKLKEKIIECIKSLGWTPPLEDIVTKAFRVSINNIGRADESEHISLRLFGSLGQVVWEPGLVAIEKLDSIIKEKKWKLRKVQLPKILLVIDVIKHEGETLSDGRGFECIFVLQSREGKIGHFVYGGL